jgi:nucleoside-diphosphate-sugar epimerase
LKASGNIGKAVVVALLDAKFKVTALNRHTSTSTLPSSVKASKVDYNNLNSLTEALRGQDALVCTLPFEAIPSQRLLIDAAIASGVKRIIPAEFGADFQNENTRNMPSFKSRLEIQNYLAEKTPDTQLTYTAVNCGCVIDIALQRGSVLKPSTCSARIFDGGEQLFSATRLGTVAKAVVGVLEHLDATGNKFVYVQELATTQNKLLAVAQNLTPGKTWTLEPVDTAALVARSDEAVAKGANPADFTVRAPYIVRSVWGRGDYGGHFKDLDNDLLGINEMTESEVENMIKQFISQG